MVGLCGIVDTGSTVDPNLKPAEIGPVLVGPCGNFHVMYLNGKSSNGAVVKMDNQKPMKVLIWACGSGTRFAGPYVAAEAKRQGFEVQITGSRSKPQQMLIALQSYRPDVVLCFAVRPNLAPYYKMIRQTGAKLVLWYPDMTEVRRDRMWKNSLNGVADALVFSILETAQRYQKLAPVVLWMPQYFDHRFCMDADGNLPARLNPAKPMYDLCFIGSCDGTRTSWLNNLEKRYRCNFFRDGILRRTEIRGYAMAEAYAQSRIAFNIQRRLFANAGVFVTSNRVYNAMGSGAFFINHAVKRLNLVFPESLCIAHDDSLETLCRIIDYYLEHDDQREFVAKLGQQEILRYHTLEQRVREYWHVLQAVHENKIEDLPTGAFGKWVQE